MKRSIGLVLWIILGSVAAVWFLQRRTPVVDQTAVLLPAQPEVPEVQHPAVAQLEFVPPPTSPPPIAVSETPQPKPASRLTREEVEYKLGELIKMQAEFEESLIQGGDYAFGRAILYFGMCMAYTLDARGEAIIPPQGVKFKMPINPDGSVPAMFDGRVYNYSHTEFPEEDQLKALRSQHGQWIMDQKSGRALGPQPTIPNELINSLLNKGREAAIALRAAGPQ